MGQPVWGCTASRPADFEKFIILKQNSSFLCDCDTKFLSFKKQFTIFAP